MLTTIIKTHNCEDTIYDVLESVKNSDEIIVVDEHSTDDTVKIANEYKAKIVYSYQNELEQILNQTVEEAQNDWILFLYDDEITDKNLLSNIKKYIEKPKKNKYAMGLAIKLFYLNKEIKAARKKSQIRLFCRNWAAFRFDVLPEIKLIKGKVHKFNRNFNPKNGFITKTKKSIFKDFKTTFEHNVLTYKTSSKHNPSVFFKPLFRFLKLYLLKGFIFDGKRGFIFCFEEAISCFILGCAEFERIQNDIQ